MKLADLPYLTRKTSRGKVYWYFRRAGSYVALPDPTAPDFLARYEAARRGGSAPREAGRTWRALIADYRRSPEFAALAPRTRADYDKVMEWVLDTMPGLEPARMNQPTVIRARDANAHRRRFADYIVQVLKLLFAHAIRIGWMTHNPARGVKPLPRGKHEVDLHGPWPRWAQDAYRAAAPYGSPERTGFELAVGVSQRIGDTLAMRWDQLGPDGFEIVQSKTATALLIPPTRELADYIAGLDRRGTTIVSADDGGPLGYSGFAKRFRAARAAAAGALREARRESDALLMDRLTVHGWRYTVAVEMAEAGASDDEIAAVTGHKTSAMLRKYAGAARQKVRARAGQGRRNG